MREVPAWTGPFDPDALPDEYVAELQQLQSNAPAMGWAFVKRRMAAELGPDWPARFASFEREAAAAASLGQVHRAVAADGTKLACKLQYPDMASAVEADLRQLKLIFGVYERYDPAIRTVATALLETLGYVADVAGTGEEALARCEGNEGSPYDVLLSDIRMPGMNGYDLAERVRRAQPGIALILMSGYAGDPTVMEASRRLGALFLEKPFTRDSLSQRLAEALQLRTRV